MELRQYTNTGPASAIDGHDGLQTHLKVAAYPYDAGIDRAGRSDARTGVVRRRGGELRFHDRDQVIQKGGQLEVHDAGFQIGHAVLQSKAISQKLRIRSGCDE